MPENENQLSSQQHRQLAAVLQRILPACDKLAFTGARKIQVIDYAETALTENRYALLRHHLPDALQRLDQAAINNPARRPDKTAFIQRDASQQDAIIEQLLTQGDQLFTYVFRQLINLGLEGLLCDPRHGGNHSQQGWRLMGYQPQETNHDHH